MKDNEEYREFVTGICKRLSLKRLSKGEFLCHKGDIGEEMYFIQEGKIGIFIESKSTDVDTQIGKLNHIEKLIKQNSAAHMEFDESTMLQGHDEKYSDSNLPNRLRERVIQNLKSAFPKDWNSNKVLFSNLEQIDFWKPEQLYLLASEKPVSYMKNSAFTFFMVGAKKNNEIIGEQALLNKAPRNATLLALTDLRLLTLDKIAFDDYMGAAAAQQETRIKFFSSSFPTIMKGAINNFHCMFQKVVKNRGEIITREGDPALQLLMIEEGEVAVVNSEQLKSMRKVVVSQLEVTVTIGKLGMVGDEMLFSDRYLFSTVALRQPTFLYTIDKSKFHNAQVILGKYVISDMLHQAKLKSKYRQQRLKQVAASGATKLITQLAGPASSSLPRSRTKTAHQTAEPPQHPESYSTIGKKLTGSVAYWNTVQMKMQIASTLLGNEQTDGRGQSAVQPKKSNRPATSATLPNLGEAVNIIPIEEAQLQETMTLMSTKGSQSHYLKAEAKNSKKQPKDSNGASTSHNTTVSTSNPHINEADEIALVKARSLRIGRNFVTSAHADPEE